MDTSSVSAETNLWPQETWDNAYGNPRTFNYAEPAASDVVVQLLDRFMPRFAKHGKCLEVGCFPGRYLAYFGRMGFQLNGIDLVPGTDTYMRSWLGSKGYDVGALERVDFFKTEAKPIYDVVYSLGFVEHFDAFLDVIGRHCDFVAPGGYLVITAPNFRVFHQKIPRLLCDRANLDRHNLLSMDPYSWANYLVAKGYQTEFCGYFGGYRFWYESQKRNFFQKALAFSLKKASVQINKLLPQISPWMGSFSGVIARKPVDARS